MKKVLFSIFVVLMTTSCGFKPLYSENSDSAEKLSQIKVLVNATGDIPAKFAHVLQKTLEDTFHSNQSHNSTHYLDVTVAKALTSYETQNNTSTRTRVSLYITLVMRDLATNKLIYTDKLIAIDSFQVADSPYSALVSEDETAIRMTKELANEIQLRILRKLGVR